MSATVFEVLFVEVPTKQAAEAGKGAVIIGDVIRVVAKDQQAAVVAAARKCAGLDDKDLAQVEVKVRPF